jgi:hypothetical protein
VSKRAFHYDGEDDLEFITDFMFAHGAEQCLDPAHWEHARRGAVIALLRSNVPLSRSMRRDLADELERLYWPTRQNRQHEKRSLNHFKADALSGEIAALASKLEKEGVRDSVRQAEEQLARQWGYASGEALNKWVRRNLYRFMRRTK